MKTNYPNAITRTSLFKLSPAVDAAIEIGFIGPNTDTLGQSAICRHRIAIFEEVSQMINEILQEESCFTLKDLAVNGHDMMTLGFQGPTIGRVLQECLDAVLDEQIPNEHEALMAFAKDRQLKS